MQDSQTQETALVLFSGGQDSTTCLAWALARYPHVETVGFRYGQRHAVEMDCRDPIRAALASPRMGPDHIVDLTATISALGQTAMTADIEIATGSDKAVLTVPSGAVIDSGERQVVLLDKGDGRFEPHAVKLGRRGDGRVEITDGLSENDRVVVAANFLIDAESNLKAALQGFTSAGKPQ